MLDLEARFSPRIIPASTEYPYGKLKPNTAPAENDGTPVAADTGNDIEGFKQAAITRANINPSGIPDNAINSQLLDGLDKRYLEIDYQPWTFATGGLLIDCSQAAKHTNNKWYSWSGVFPEGGKVVTAGTDPTVDVGYVSRLTPFEHLPIVGASSADNTGTNYVQDLIFDAYGHVTDLVSTEIREGNTSQTGIVQLTDSTSSTSTTTAATPNSVKNAYDLADAAIPSIQKGVVGGVATLDNNGKVPTAQLPSAYEIGAVPLTRTVNSKPLSEDVTITALDVNAAPSSHVGATGTAHGVATTSVAGFMSATDKTKLDGISAGNIGDQTITLTGDVTGSGTGSFATTLANSGVTAGIYSKVNVDNKGRVTAGASLVDSDIPSLGWSKITSGKPTTLSGYGITDAVVNTTTINGKPLTTAITLTATDVGAIGATVATTTTNGLMSSTDKTKLDGIAAGANAYVHPTNDGNKHVPATGTSNNGKWLKAGSTAGSFQWDTIYSHDVGLSYVDNTSDLNKPISTATQAALDYKYSPSNKPTAADIGALASSGTAVAASKLSVARTIAGKSFDGTANISIAASDVGALPASGGTISGGINVGDSIKLTSSSSLGLLNSFGRTITKGSNTTVNVFGNTMDEVWLVGPSLTSWRVRYNDTNYTIYHTGNKPTPAEIGAQPATSDSRVKSNIASLHPVLDKIMLIDPKTFTMEGREGNCVGTIAQDWEVDFPEVILNVPSTSQGEPEMLKGIDALGTIGILLKAIQELKGELEDLKNR